MVNSTVGSCYSRARCPESLHNLRRRVYVQERKTQVHQMLKPLDDVNKIIALIAQVSNADPHSVQQRLIAEAEEIGSTVYAGMMERNIPLYTASEQLDEFYREADAFLYETTVWNTCKAKQQMRDFVVSRLAQFGKPNADIFCFGDGLGFDSTYLAKQGHKTRYFEPSLRCQDYASAVFAANQADVMKLDGLDEIEPESLDAVVCLDVLEHVPAPQGLVEKFQSWLKPDGLLFVHAPFWCLHWTRSTHLRENKKYSGDLEHIYHACGFQALDASVFWDPILLQKNDGGHSLTLAATTRINLGGFLLRLGRRDDTVHTWIARQIARAPGEWVARLRAAKV